MLLKLIKLCKLMGAPLYGGSNKNEPHVALATHAPVFFETTFISSQSFLELQSKNHQKDWDEMNVVSKKN